MKKLPSLTIFFPSLNEAFILPQLINDASIIAKKIATDYEIIVVDDGSTDNTLKIVEKLKEKNSKLKMVHHKTNRGYGGALVSGFSSAKKEWIFYTDADGQYSLKELPLLVEKAGDLVDVVNGYKIKRSDSRTRIYIGSIYNWLLHFIYHIPISDIDCDFRLIRNSVIKKIKLKSNSGLICLELIMQLQKVGARFKEVGVHHFHRKYGESRYFKLSHLLNTLREHIIYFSSWLFHRG
jgi:glycosyltransferase involved in cell wall biosynthesis